MFGVIEGFYGRPWSWAQRAEVATWCADRGMDHFLYAPKDDPLHRERWREPYGSDVLAEFERLASNGRVTVGFGLSPGLSIDANSVDDRAAMGAKVDQVVEAGVGLVALLLDDIPVRPGLGPEHARLATWLVEHLAGRASVVLCPTEYTGTRSTPYLDALAEGLPAEVPVFWTGATVVCPRIELADALARAASLGGRPPLVWDNYPVNDATMTDRLFLGPLRGRDRTLPSAVAGWFANPMPQARSSLLPLASIAAFLRGDDPTEQWRAEAEGLGWLVAAEGCDGAVPGDLVSALEDSIGTPDWAPALGAMDAWARAAASVDAPGIDGADEAGPWLEQLRMEAGMLRTATRLLQLAHPVARWDAGDSLWVAPPDSTSAAQHAVALAALWPGIRRAERTVLGPRCSVRPVLSQDAGGEWEFHLSSVERGHNALDRLIEVALETADRCRSGAPLLLEIDGAVVPIDHAGGRVVPPAGTQSVLLRSGSAATRVRPGDEPPLPDRRLAV